VPKLLAKVLRGQSQVPLNSAQSGVSHIRRKCWKHFGYVYAVSVPRRNAMDRERKPEVMHARLVVWPTGARNSCPATEALKIESKGDWVNWCAFDVYEDIRGLNFSPHGQDEIPLEQFVHIATDGNGSYPALIVTFESNDIALEV